MADKILEVHRSQRWTGQLAYEPISWWAMAKRGTIATTNTAGKPHNNPITTQRTQGMFLSQSSPEAEENKTTKTLCTAKQDKNTKKICILTMYIFIFLLLHFHLNNAIQR